MSRGPVIMLDPGHGGPRNPGTHGPGLRESTYVLELCTWLQYRAQHVGAPYTVAMTRSTDTMLSLDARGRSAKDAAAIACISVHVNAGPPTLSGTEVYYWPGDTAAQAIAATIQRSVPAPLYRSRRAARPATEPTGPDTSWLQRPRAVLWPHAQRQVPAALVELGYRTAQRDLEALLSGVGQLGLAVAIEAGMCEAWRMSASQ